MPNPKVHDIIERSVNDMSLVDSEHCDISVISTEMPINGVVLKNAGIDIKPFESAGMVVHLKHKAIPVARSQWVRVVDNQVRAKTEYLKTTIGEATWQKVRNGDLRGKSVTFLPTEVREGSDLTPEERMGGIRQVVERSELLDYSVCQMPKNPAARILEVSTREADPEPQGQTLEDILAICKQIDPKRISESVLRRVMGKV